MPDVKIEDVLRRIIDNYSSSSRRLNYLIVNELDFKIVVIQDDLGVTALYHGDYQKCCNCIEEEKKSVEYPWLKNFKIDWLELPIAPLRRRS